MKKLQMHHQLMLQLMCWQKNCALHSSVQPICSAPRSSSKRRVSSGQSGCYNRQCKQSVSTWTHRIIITDKYVRLQKQRIRCHLVTADENRPDFVLLVTWSLRVPPDDTAGTVGVVWYQCVANFNFLCQPLWCSSFKCCLSELDDNPAGSNH